MRIFVDADACPKVIKEVLFRAAVRTKTELILVANHLCKIPLSPLIKLILVPHGFDEADKRIATDILAGDLVITADIPLAASVVESGAIALNPRGKLYTKENIKQQLAVRNLMAQLRDDQLISGGPGAFNHNDTQALANQLDRLLIKNHISQVDNEIN